MVRVKKLLIFLVVFVFAAGFYTAAEAADARDSQYVDSGIVSITTLSVTSDDDELDGGTGGSEGDPDSYGDGLGVKSGVDFFLMSGESGVSSGTEDTSGLSLFWEFLKILESFTP